MTDNYIHVELSEQDVYLIRKLIKNAGPIPLNNNLFEFELNVDGTMNVLTLKYGCLRDVFDKLKAIIYLPYMSKYAVPKSKYMCVLAVLFSFSMNLSLDSINIFHPGTYGQYAIVNCDKLAQRFTAKSYLFDELFLDKYEARYDNIYAIADIINNTNKEITIEI
jgi:hypothetical protein